MREYIDEESLGAETAVPTLYEKLQSRVTVASILDMISEEIVALQMFVVSEVDPLERFNKQSVLRGQELALTSLMVEILDRLEAEKRR